MEMTVRLVVFDMDGLMFDTERISFLSFSKAVESCGFQLDEATFRKTIAANVKEVRQIYLEQFGKNFPFEEMLERKFSFAEDYVHQQGVPIKPGLYELLTFLKAREIKMAVATSSNRSVAVDLLQLAKVAQQFDCVVCGDEIERSKPDPEIFLQAAKRLQCDPEDCLVLEDANKGVLAAHRAGMQVIMVPDLVAPDAETRKRALAILNSLSDVQRYLEEILV